MWLKPETKPDYGVQCYSDLLSYVDNIHQNADGTFQCVHQSFLFKPGYGFPDMYLGAKLHKTRLHNELWAWAMNLVKYVCEAVRNYNAHLVANYSDRFRLPRRVENPFKMGYNPEFDVRPEFGPVASSCFQSITGILR